MIGISKLTEQQSLEIINLAKKREKITNEEFYILYTGYLDDNNIFFNNPDDEDLEESRLFNILLKDGFIGNKVVFSVSNSQKFLSTLTTYIQSLNLPFYYFHFFREDTDSNMVSYSEYYKKWKENPPRGWFAYWCSCGHFEPITRDLSEEKIENDLTIIPKEDPVVFGINEIKSVDFHSNSSLKFNLYDGSALVAFPLKLDNSFIFNYLKNPLDII